MESIVNALFVILWMVVGFLALRWLGALVFHERFRPEVAAAAVVLAFAVGALGPFSGRHSGATETAAVPAAAPPESHPAAGAPAAGPGNPQPGQDVSRRCRTASLKPEKGHGSVDVLGVPTREGDRVVSVASGGPVARDEVLVATGWAADKSLTKPAVGACLVVDGSLVRDGSSVYGAMRTDVATAFHRDALRNTGFAVSLPASKLPAGTHTITVAAVAADGSANLIDGGGTISRP